MSTIELSGKAKAAFEVVAIVAFALILKELLDPFFWRFSAPVSLIATVILLTVLAHRHGENWSAMGLKSLPGTRAKLLLIPQAAAVFLIVLATLSAVTFAIEAAGLELLSEKTHGEIERWGDVTGNLRLYLLMLAISWISGGFAEEMFFRGFLITRLQTVFAGVRFATVLAIVLPAILFGYVHVYYQGLQGFVNAGIVGLIFGTAFLLYKRNLWPLVLAHGFINSLGFTAEFMGWDI